MNWNRKRRENVLSVIKSIIEKLKLKELFAIIFIAALIITFVPTDLAQKMQIDNFRSKYQTYISLCMIVVGAYYVLCIAGEIKNFIWKKTHSWEKVAINYMKKYMSPDEMGLLVEAFYDRENNRFCSSGQLDYSDGRIAPLESKKIIYRASQLGSLVYGFAYNLQPYALKFLNENLVAGNIIVDNKGVRWQFK